MMGEVKLYTRRDLARMASLGIVGTALAGRTSGVCKGLLGLRGAMMVKRVGGRVYENRIVVNIPDGATSGFTVSFSCDRPTSAQVVDWGDGTTSSVGWTSASHTYAASGRYDITWPDELANVTARGTPYVESVNWHVPPTYLRDYAFQSCTSLASVGDLSACTSIGVNAFMHCSALNSDCDLSACTSIGTNSFNGCTSLASVGDLSACTSIGEFAFYKTSFSSIYTPLADKIAASSCSNLVIIRADSATIIPDYNCQSNPVLDTIYAPNVSDLGGGYMWYQNYKMRYAYLGELTRCATNGSYYTATRTEPDTRGVRFHILIKNTMASFSALASYGSIFSDKSRVYCSDGYFYKVGYTIYSSLYTSLDDLPIEGDDHYTYSIGSAQYRWSENTHQYEIV